MANKKGTSASQKAQYQSYKAEQRWKKNRILKLQRHVKRYPQDQQAKAALARAEDGDMVYRRKRPLSHKKVWTATARYEAQLLRQAGSKGTDVFLSDEVKLRRAKSRIAQDKKRSGADILEDVA